MSNGELINIFLTQLHDDGDKIRRQQNEHRLGPTEIVELK